MKGSFPSRGGSLSWLKWIGCLANARGGVLGLDVSQTVGFEAVEPCFDLMIVKLKHPWPYCRYQRFSIIRKLKKKKLDQSHIISNSLHGVRCNLNYRLHITLNVSACVCVCTHTLIYILKNVLQSHIQFWCYCLKYLCAFPLQKGMMTYICNKQVTYFISLLFGWNWYLVFIFAACNKVSC